MQNRNKNKAGDPEILYIDRQSIALTIEDTYEGEGVKYIRFDTHIAEIEDIKNTHDKRVTELLRSNNETLYKLRDWKKDFRD